MEDYYGLKVDLWFHPMCICSEINLHLTALATLFILNTDALGIIKLQMINV